jgi:hypothetical protein
MDHLSMLFRDLELIVCRLVERAHRCCAVHWEEAPALASINCYTLYDTAGGTSPGVGCGSVVAVGALVGVSTCPATGQPQQTAKHHKRRGKEDRLVPSALMGEHSHQHCRPPAAHPETTNAVT